jgi:hypothetical protein
MGRILTAVLVAMTMGTKAFGCDAVLPDHVRILDCRLAAAVANAAGTRSMSLKDLLDRVERTNGLVYVAAPPISGPATRLLGGLSHRVSAAGPYRVLTIVVSGKVDDATIATVGHELRHALELLELSAATNEADVDAFFNGIGWHTSERTVETQAAMDAGNAVARELKTSRRSVTVR